MKITNFNPRYGGLLANGTSSSGSSPGALTSAGGEKHVIVNHGNLGATEPTDVAAGNYHIGTLDTGCTITFTGWTSGVLCEIGWRIIEDQIGGHTPTFSGVTWVGGTTPTHTTTASSVTEYIFWSSDGGTTIYGGQVGAAGTSTGGGSSSSTEGHVHAVNEEHVGDGTSTVYTLANAAEPYTLAAYVSGLRMDVTLSGTNDTVTFPGPPAAFAPIRFDYLVELSP